MQRSLNLSSLLLLLLTACLFCGTAAAAQESPTNGPEIQIAPSVGPPTTSVAVYGGSFDPYAAVDIYFDTADLALVVTNGAGSFGGGSCPTCGIVLKVPASAVPGTHWITAVERYGQKAAQATFLVRTDWAQFHFEPSHKGVNPYENVLSPATVGNIGLHWSYKTAGGVNSSPVVAGGMVYVESDDGNLYAFNTSTQALLWTWYTGEGGSQFASPAVAKGVVYVGGFDEFQEANLYALNASNGVVLWKHYIGGGGPFAPSVANGVVYVATSWSDYAWIWAFNARTGEQLWNYSMDDGYVYASPTVANGMVYFGCWDYYLYALNASTGVLVWKSSVGYFVSSTAAVANGVVYIGAADDNLYALNASTGALLWKYTTGFVASSPAVANGVVYIASDDRYLYALNAYTGALLWKYGTGDSVVSSPVVANGVVYVGSDDGNLYALNAGTGSPLWQYTTGDSIYSSSAVANGVVYVGSADGNLYAFDLTGGLLSKKFSPPERPDPNSLRPDWTLKPN